MPIYFGCTFEVGSSGEDSQNVNITVRNKDYVTGYTCPGTGTPAVSEISAYLRKRSGTGAVRCAVYDSAHNLICQGNSSIALTSVISWQGHVGADQITPNPANLTAGVQYDIAFTLKSSSWGIYFFESFGSSAVVFTYPTHYVDSGFPASLADMTNDVGLSGMRCGVDSAAANWIMPHKRFNILLRL